jgi:hypothetical protein
MVVSLRSGKLIFLDFPGAAVIRSSAKFNLEIRWYRATASLVDAFFYLKEKNHGLEKNIIDAKNQF